MKKKEFEKQIDEFVNVLQYIKNKDRDGSFYKNKKNNAIDKMKDALVELDKAFTEDKKAKRITVKNHKSILGENENEYNWIEITKNENMSVGFMKKFKDKIFFPLFTQNDYITKKHLKAFSKQIDPKEIPPSFWSIKDFLKIAKEYDIEWAGWNSNDIKNTILIMFLRDLTGVRVSGCHH